MRYAAREGIDCPGDTVYYNCSILSNSENVHLYWNVTFPGLMPISIFYDNTSNVNIMDYWSMNISSILLDYRSEEYIESIIVLTVLQNFSMNGTEVICGITDLINESVIVQLDTSSMLIRICVQYYSMFNIGYDITYTTFLIMEWPKVYLG